MEAEQIIMTGDSTFWELLVWTAVYQPFSLLLLIGIVLGLGIFSLWLIRRSSPDIQFGKDRKVSFGGRSTNNSHSVAKYLSLIEKVRKTERKAVMYQTHKIIADQMAYAEQKVEEYIDNLKVRFIVAMKRNLPTDTSVNYTKHPDYIVFNDTMTEIRRNLINMIRTIMRENHLSDRQDDEYAAYMKKKTDYIKGRITTWLNELYSCEVVTRSEFDDVLEEYEDRSPSLRNMMEDLLITARHISIKYEEIARIELENVQKEIEEFLAEINQ